jgi:hypothetical protein
MGLLDNYVIPQVWQDNLPFTISEKSKLFTSDAVMRDTDPPFNKAGIYVHTPFLKEPKARWEIPSTIDLVAHKLTQNKDTMICITRQIDYLVTKQMMRRSGVDLGKILYDNVADYVAKQYELALIDILKAIYGPNGVLYATHTVETDTSIDFNTIFNGKSKLGDGADQLAISTYHSKVVNCLREKGMISDMFTWKEKQVETGSISKVANLPIIETDLMPKVTISNTDKYFSFLLAKDSIYFANPYFEVETWEYPRRNGGEQHIIITSDFCIHLPGVRYNLNVQEPTDAQLAAPTTWEKIADNDKDIKVVALLTPIAD